MPDPLWFLGSLALPGPGRQGAALQASRLQSRPDTRKKRRAKKNFIFGWTHLGGIGNVTAWKRGWSMPPANGRPGLAASIECAPA
jgi:hypothetical protein